ncbi:MAG: hypothetical protein K6E41_03065 [Solobacterium sp.]|nr:hypothetical protein [Solobacterium sp.]
MKIGAFVRYIGEDTIVYQPGHIYEVTDYDEQLGLYQIMSEAEVPFLMCEDLFEEVSIPEENERNDVQ